MGFLLFAFLAILFIIWGNLGDKEYNVKRAIKPCLAGSAMAMVFYIVIATALYLTSFDSYAKARATYDKVGAQYGQAVTIYANKATIDVRKVGDTYTDLRFQGYQESMSKLIIDLRDTISRYNASVIEKRVWAKSFFFGWYIVEADPDMKLIDIINTIPEQK
jgi:hypothetical protein